MKILGINTLNHDASISMIEDGEVLFAAHSERYSGIKNDSDLHPNIFEDCINVCGEPDKIAYFEYPYLKKLRQLYAGQYSLLKKESPDYFLKMVNDTLRKSSISNGDLPPSQYTRHHHSHAAGGYYTSTYDHATIVVLDSIGEWETFTIWEGIDNQLHKRFSQSLCTCLLHKLFQNSSTSSIYYAKRSQLSAPHSYCTT